MKNTPVLKTRRLELRQFTQRDIAALFAIYGNRTANEFLPWFPLQDEGETKRLFQEKYEDFYKNSQQYRYAVCKTGGEPIGYVHLEAKEESHDLGYALLPQFWGQGIITEACRAVIQQAKKDGIAYITATHDRNNPASGRVMQKLGMRYCYTYREQWQPKNFSVDFRLYQMNFTCPEKWVFSRYWEQSAVHFVEPGL